MVSSFLIFRSSFCSSSWCQLTIPKLYLSTGTANVVVFTIINHCRFKQSSSETGRDSVMLLRNWKNIALGWMQLQMSSIFNSDDEKIGGGGWGQETKLL